MATTGAGVALLPALTDGGAASPTADGGSPTPDVSSAPSPTAEASEQPSPPPSPSRSAAGKPKAPSPSPTVSSRIIGLEDEVTRLINKERKRAGCSTVHTDERLRTAARRHSEDMAKNDYFSHTGLNGSSFVDRIAAAGYPRSAAAGENIAYGYGTPAEVVKGWMNSEGHRRNILNCSAKATGVGLAYRGSRPYWTQVFGRT